MCVVLPEITIGEDADEAQGIGPHHSTGAVLALILHLGRVLKEQVRRHDAAANTDGRFSNLSSQRRTESASWHEEGVGISSFFFY